MPNKTTDFQKIIDQFEHTPTNEWRDILCKYNPDDLITIIGILLMSNFYTRTTLSNLLCVVENSIVESDD